MMGKVMAGQDMRPHLHIYISTTRDYLMCAFSTESNTNLISMTMSRGGLHFIPRNLLCCILDGPVSLESKPKQHKIYALFILNTVSDILLGGGYT